MKRGRNEKALSLLLAKSNEKSFMKVVQHLKAFKISLHLGALIPNCSWKKKKENLKVI